MRGFGVTSVSFAVETHMNRIAQVLGLDPWELRLKNANRIGDTTGNGVTLKDPSTVPVTLAAAERVGIELARRVPADDVRAASRRPAARAPRRRSSG